MDIHMNLFFKLILIAKLSARDLFLINYPIHRKSEVASVVRTLHSEFGIPKKAIKIKEVNGACKKKAKNLLQICLDGNREIKVIQVNSPVLRRSFNHFRND